jgi:transcriptional regulator with GAF, ATPase, and Fis domain
MQSLRKDEMFVEMNCAAIPEDLIDSELFGHRKSSFPGATADKEGKFQKAWRHEPENAVESAANGRAAAL